MAASICAFVQARMSSRRFPGKVLAPLHGKPLIMHLLSCVERSLPSIGIVVATSYDTSDDPLALYLKNCGVAVFRGPLENVFERFRRCSSKYPSDWILRLCADSPFPDARVLQAVASYADKPACDLVTTIFPRTFPKGHNAELISVNTFMGVDVRELSTDDQEHVTPFFYRNADRFDIVNVNSGNPELAALRLTVDTVEDLHRLERLSEMEIYAHSYSSLPSLSG